MTTTSYAAPVASAAQRTSFAIIFAVAFCHGINDIMQSLLTAIYPILKDSYGLDYIQLGLLTLTFQCTASLLQPLIGIYTDKRPLPYSIATGMAFTLVGLIVLGFAHDYWLLLAGSALIGFGSAVFHPESSRVARLASGGRHGFAQSTFQVGGNTGQAIGPLLAAFVVLPHGQTSIAWFALAALCGMLVLSWVGRWYAEHMRAAAKRPAASTALPFDRRTTVIALTVLTLLIAYPLAMFIHRLPRRSKSVALAAVVLPKRSILMTTFSSGMPKRSAVAVIMRRFAWCEMKQSTSWPVR